MKIGYENQDWFVKTPVLNADDPIDLSPEVVDETLKYFILSADRLSQMTKTYNDIDAVTRLLEEVHNYCVVYFYLIIFVCMYL